MSKHNNVNPGQYKVAGRERPGNAVAKSPKDPGSDRQVQERWDRRQEQQHEDQLPADRPADQSADE